MDGVGDAGGEPAMLSARQSLALLAPAAVLYSLLLVLPLVLLIRVSLLDPGPGASLDGPLTGASYAMLADPYILDTLWRTVRISTVVTLVCLLLGYPVALSIVRSQGVWRHAQTLLVVSPLFVSVVVRRTDEPSGSNPREYR